MDSTHALSADARALMAFQAKRKSTLVSYLLWLFLGGLGAHRYYNGRVGSGVALMVLNLLGWLTLAVVIGGALLVGVAVWVIVDAFLIPGWVRDHNARLMLALDSGANPAAITAF